MNKKGQTNIIEAFLMFLVFIIVWFAALGDWVAKTSGIVLATGNFTGFEAFFYSNLNLVIWVIMTCAMIGWGLFRAE